MGDLVIVHKAASVVEAEALVEFLRERDIEATIPDPATPAEAARRAGYCDTDTTSPVLALDTQADAARQLVAEFLANPASQDTGVPRHHPDKEQIHELRAAVREERQTFTFLGWAVVAFLVAVLLWWAAAATLAEEPLTPRFFWLTIVTLVAAAALAGYRTGRRAR
jgi:hypothetical protein